MSALDALGRTANRLRRAPRPTARGWALIVVGVLLVVLAFALHTRGLLLPGLIGIGMPLAALAWVALRRPNVQVVRVFDARMLPVGGATDVQLVVQNRSARRLDGATWRDETDDSLVPQPEAVLPTAAAAGRPGESVSLSYRLEPERRGVFAVGPLRLTVHDPFGLARGDSTHGPVAELVVTPRVATLEEGAPGGAGGDGTVRSLARRTIPNADELIAREYRRGDPYRRVHWRATARLGELMVRQEEQSGDPEAVLVLDTGAEAFRRTGWQLLPSGELAPVGFELGVEVAAAVGVRLIRDGFRVQFLRTVEADGRPGGLHGARSVEVRGASGVAGLLDQLARLDEPTVPDGLEWPSPQLRGRGHAERRPVYAVLVDPDREVLAALEVLASRFEPRTVIAIGGLSADARTRLESADWNVVTLTEAGALSAAWEYANAGRGSLDAD
ncbi:DUF58 domain-containing protein [Agromyces seonyuensis]|uniref:DUF58 domain-containing protein n=1 Tax=Agromyces seonyuensis TaxID=2662446 RepID=A0A6I4NTT9_9MICO|nr:DUF58 domain-containing protein [Agromyces seonyuensis]MWB97690.1 DUF58 domain-containing protein [Agromyces seonyuensis]